MRGVAGGAVLLHRLVTPQERAAPLGMAGITGLVDRVLRHEHGSDRSVRVVTVRAPHLTDRQRMRRDPVNLGTLRLVAREARFLLRQAVHDAILRRVDHMAGGAGNIATLVFTPRPVLALSAGVTAEAGFRLQVSGSCASYSKVDIDRRARRGAVGILDMRHARAVTGLAPRRAFIGLDAMRRLVDRQNWLGFRLVMAVRANRISLESSVGSGDGLFGSRSPAPRTKQQDRQQCGAA